MSTKTLLIIYMLAGIAVGSVTEAHLHKEVGFSSVVQYSILAVAVLLVIWNCIMYKQAFATPETRFEPFAPSESEAYSSDARPLLRG